MSSKTVILRCQRCGKLGRALHDVDHPLCVTCHRRLFLRLPRLITPGVLGVMIGLSLSALAVGRLPMTHMLIGLAGAIVFIATLHVGAYELRLRQQHKQLSDSHEGEDQ